MKVSLNWLREYLDIDISTVEIADRLTMAGLEVESVEIAGDKYRDFVVGEVIEVKKHPKADKLTVCSVNVGNDQLQIICGAPNVAKGQKVAVGLLTAVVPRDQHDPDGKPFTLSRVSIRGIESSGMICSEYELELGDDREGILILEKDAKPGLPLAEYLGIDDTVFEIGVTPNRPDAMSHIGVARELGAILGREIKIPKPSPKESKRNIKDFAGVRIKDPANCPRYTARVIFNLKTGPSPEWIRNRLKAVGIRPVNNIVDVTNYVLMECGHPLHAFDYDKITGHEIIVRPALPDEEFITLDHKRRNLHSSTLMICDKTRPVAIAGVMGGEYSEISDQTVNIIIESAYFNPKSIRRTSKYYGLSTDASQRFERGADPNITEWAVDRASQMIAEFTDGEILKGRIDIYPEKIQSKNVNLRVGYANKFLDISLTEDDIIKILSRYQFKFIARDDCKDDVYLNFEIPTFRPDIEKEIDLIEEIARGYGYDSIPIKKETRINFSDIKTCSSFIEEVRSEIIGAGFNEIITNSMQAVGLTSKFSSDYVKIINPISQDMATLRTTLIPSMLEVIQHNIYHGNNNLRLFEIGKSYHHEPGSTNNVLVPGYIEKDILVLALTGQYMPGFWDKTARYVDIFDIKGEIETLFVKIFLDNIKFIPYPTTDALTELGILIEINKIRAGYFGKIRKDILSGFGIDQEVYCAEIDLSVLEKGAATDRRFVAPPRFPHSLRDIAVIVDEEIQSGTIELEIRKHGGNLLKSVELFDVFYGEQIGSRKKSYAYNLVFLSEDHTLVQDEVDKVITKIGDGLKKSLNANIRKKEEVQ